MCLLQRHYPTEKGKVTLIFQPLLDLPSMELFVLTADKSDRQYTGDFNVQVDPGARSYTGRYYSVHMPGGDARLTRLSVDRVALDGLRDGDTMTIQAKPVGGSFAIVRPEKARPALDKCITDLKKSWGVDPDRDARAVTRLDGNPARYFNFDSYPAEALSKGIYGRVVALLNIAPDGTVSNCRIVSSAGKALNEGTCVAARRVRFTPPRDADGKPMATTYLLPVRWVLPGSPG
jgi:TonB family protein